MGAIFPLFSMFAHNTKSKSSKSKQGASFSYHQASVTYHQSSACCSLFLGLRAAYFDPSQLFKIVFFAARVTASADSVF